MQRLLSTALVLAWGLWFGAIVMVFVTVTSLFSTFAEQRQIAGAAAAGVFRRFEVLALAAACVAVVSALLLWIRAPRPRHPGTVPASLIVAALLVIVSAFFLTPRIDELRRRGVPSDSDVFKSAHRASSTLYSGQALMLFTAGIFLPQFLKRTSTSPAPAAA